MGSFFFSLFIFCSSSSLTLFNYNVSMFLFFSQDGAGGAHFLNLFWLSSLSNILDDLNCCFSVRKLLCLQLGVNDGPIHHHLIGCPPPHLTHNLCTRNCGLNGILQIPHAGGIPSGPTIFNADTNHAYPSQSTAEENWDSLYLVPNSPC